MFADCNGLDFPGIGDSRRRSLPRISRLWVPITLLPHPESLLTGDPPEYNLARTSRHLIIDFYEQLRMNWVYVEDAMPIKWDIVRAHCENLSGEVTELDAYWTGQYWRIIGASQGLEDLQVTMWAQKLPADQV